MPSIHTIRLRGPWECRAPEAPAHIGGRVRFPIRWADAFGSEFAGPVSLRRNFGRPTGLHPNDRVFLSLADLGHPAELRLNGDRLGHVAPQTSVQFDIGRLLTDRNELVLTVRRANPSAANPASDSGDLLGDFALEIHSAGSD